MPVLHQISTEGRAADRSSLPSYIYRPPTKPGALYYLLALLGPALYVVAPPGVALVPATSRYRVTPPAIFQRSVLQCRLDISSLPILRYPHRPVVVACWLAVVTAHSVVTYSVTSPLVFTTLLTSSSGRSPSRHVLSSH
ncbi:hypothetical protein ON010_g11029 [Phytophthora cinnamomi]|nr:hypothetical protein ON010_g11029 [Phytophthora cinnamomi]